MKVVHLITRLIIGGAQENTVLTCAGLARDFGDEVTLLTGPPLGPEGSLLERAQREPFELREIPELRRAIRPARDWRSYRAIVRHLRELRPDVVHTHSSKAGILGRAAAAKLGLPAVHTVHGPSFHPGQAALVNRMFIGAERWAAQRCQNMICVADAMARQYLDAGIGVPEQYVTIYSGMEVEPFLTPPRAPSEVRAELGFDPDQVVVGKVARLFHLKGHADVVAAAERVVARHPRTRFLFVGDGILRPQIEQALSRAGLSDHVRLTGLVPPARMPELIAAMDLVVHTSLREGLARVLPQALIAGRPVISYDVDGAREVVLPDETGILLAPGAVDALAEAIARLVADPDLRRRLGETGRARFTEQFRCETMVRRIRGLYDAVLSSRRPVVNAR